MFGYITINKSEMKFKDYDVYHSFYCGLCQVLKNEHHRRGQLTLSFDMTFLLVLLSGLYEPETHLDTCTCIAHPFEKHESRTNAYTSYVGDMNLLLSYLKCKDDWADEKKKKSYLFAKALSPEIKKVKERYPEKVSKIISTIDELTKNEIDKETDIDKMGGYFGQIMAEIFAPKNDEWEKQLRTIGFFLGKFIYLIDAYEDIEEDMKDGNYNPFHMIYRDSNFEERCNSILTMMMAECSSAFEKLPIIEYVDILRNILYSGVWCRYETIRAQRISQQEEKHGSI
ncbi:DUF5685 family protein [Lachnospiraceae bacterium OttesenSCG-928-E19]|nr:DUF5685 family protein [Lachnospiraceae bacterium OttesenSCG-928-E19]